MFQDRKEHAQPLNAKTHHRRLSINIYRINNNKVIIRLRRPNNYLSPSGGYVRFLQYYRAPTVQYRGVIRIGGFVIHTWYRLFNVVYSWIYRTSARFPYAFGFWFAHVVEEALL